ncbi:hypothetical protein GII30_20910 [Gordonia amarae]|uniref:SnoaL-like domain-containing protein n=2 Tax=Gordonia amarae TaxID=36821 RepID=G7GIR1_9ACTN|nr:nuclear transport factor 2 family protein [Gordonia amarae]MCS3880910.1 ketosteroid isomerase-like protein [Gordonia amarae]QHN19167.1 hypothetical protein GII35_21205 [Gordonia amarae]QHN23643.1 hypothetical protein GII34_20705 [Gordonia amarae]QHN32553.1 hypothetical protein GII32_21075 [Gordonia amarae]QHN41302.1 hypothetical protein GII30_20910 [Gordonia amarae]
MSDVDAFDGVVKKYLNAVADQNFQQFGELITEDCEFTLVPIGYTWRGREQVIGALTVSGDGEGTGGGRKVRITNSFANADQVLLEYEREATIAGRTIVIDGYCWIAHIQDGRIDSVREYINPSNPVIALAMTFVLRVYPRLTRRKARR